MHMLIAPLPATAKKEKGFQERRRKGQLMPKMKTHRGMAKRVRKTGTGKLMRAKAFKSHILTKKSPKRKRATSATRPRSPRRIPRSSSASSAFASPIRLQGVIKICLV